MECVATISHLSSRLWQVTHKVKWSAKNKFDPSCTNIHPIDVLSVCFQLYLILNVFSERLSGRKRIHICLNDQVNSHEIRHDIFVFFVWLADKSQQTLCPDNLISNPNTFVCQNMNTKRRHIFWFISWPTATRNVFDSACSRNCWQSAWDRK
jgi:hypothetical protein